MTVERALALADLGWPVFPVKSNSKRPLTKNGFKDATTDKEKIKRLWARALVPNIGVVTGDLSGIGVIDVDVKNGVDGRQSLKALGYLPPTLTARTPSGGYHLYYRVSEPLPSRIGIVPGVDFKCNGGYVVAPGSLIDDKGYEWEDSEAHIVALPATAIALVKKGGRGASHKPKAPLAQGAIPEGRRNSALTSLAGTMRRKGMEVDEIFTALKVVNEKRCQPALPDSEVETIAASISRYPATQAIGSNGMTQANGAARPAVNGSGTSTEEGEAMPPGFTDDSLALEFTALYAETWRYVAGWGSWLYWSGECWVMEQTLRVFDLARKVCREASAFCDHPKIAAKVASAPTVAAVERLARYDRKHAAAVEQWDAEPGLLNTHGKVVDLQTGKLRPHDPKDYFTKITSAAITQAIMDADLAALCPTWFRFLADVTAGDEELQRYLARFAGYALTGDTSEHALGFFYGTGGNGKSVFLNTLAAVWGDYAMTAAMDTFLETKNDHHPTDLAGLRGARLVISIEVEKGRRWAEAKIKSLTGGDRISARFMRQDFFEYTPQFKLLIAGNNKPALRDVDEAMKRRLHLVPFTITVPPERRDKALSKKLLKERDGILRWAIEGCLEWQRIGLKPPPSVVSATEEYFEAEDGIGRWVAEACVANPTTKSKTTDLFASWKQWAERAGEFPGSLKSFSQMLSKRGFRKLPGRHAGFIGLAPAEGERQEDML